jgi:hypothetical protein
MTLVRTFPLELYRRALQDWAWLELDRMTPLCTSPFGDVFFFASDGIWWLDQLEGTLTREFESRDEMVGVLATPDGADRYLLAALAEGALRMGLRPGPEEILGFDVSPLFGAPFTTENVRVFSFVAYSGINAQLHRQLSE